MAIGIGMAKEEGMMIEEVVAVVVGMIGTAKVATQLLRGEEGRNNRPRTGSSVEVIKTKSSHSSH